MRIFRLERTKQRHNFETAERYRHINAQVAGGLELRIFEYQLGLFKFGQSLTAALEVRRSMLGQAHPACGPGKKSRTELLLESANSIAHARLRYAEIGSGSHKALPLRHLHKDRQWAQILHFLSLTVINHITVGPINLKVPKQ
jgi:hypothetical protein